VKCRSKVSWAQALPQVPESGESLGYGRSAAWRSRQAVERYGQVGGSEQVVVGEWAPAGDGPPPELTAPMHHLPLTPPDFCAS
jgi:hypothetical protein